MIFQEDPLTSCRVLTRNIKDPAYAGLRLLLTEDFFTKCQHVQRDAAFQYIAAVLRAHLPLAVGNLLERIVTTDSNILSATEIPIAARQNVDVAIVTVIRRELLAAKMAFGIPTDKPEDLNINGQRYWRGEIACAPGRRLTFVLTMVGEPRNTPCAIACGQLFGLFNVGACVLVGIGAGLEGSLRLGDVVAAEAVVDYEGQRLEPEGPKARPNQFTLQRLIQRDLQNFVVTDEQLRLAISESKDKCDEEALTILEGPEFNPKYSRGVVLSGEKLVADNSLARLRDQYDERVRILDMEGSGFAQACNEHSVQWAIFRGVSDYGTPAKRSTKIWQIPATLAAAHCARLFLCSEYRKPTF